MSKDLNNTEEKQNLKHEIREYAEKRFELFVLTVSEQVSLMITHAFQRFLGFLILAFGLFFLWFAVAYTLGELLGNTGGGFAISSIPFLIYGFIFINNRSKRFTEKFQAGLISKVLDNFDKERNESEENNGKAG
jgi:hypothetical protein